MREYVEIGGGVIDVERVLSWKTIFDPDQVCINSQHPDHIGCGASALYVVSWADALHDEVYHRSLCSAHVTGYFHAAIVSNWCPCVDKHRECPTVGARIDRLRER